jgi:hypothetical protein
MKAKFLSVIFSLLILSASAYAQDEMFKVLASKGANKVVSPNSAEQKPVLIGKKLYKDDKIIVAENSYLGLAHKNGKTIELKKAGTYEISKLSSEVASQNAGVAKKYVDFVAGEMTSTNESMAKDRHKYMAVNGAVERGTSDIKVLSPTNSYALSTPVTLRWLPLKDSAVTYVVTLTDLADEPVYSVETKDNFVVVDLNKLNFKTEKNFIWKVSKKNSKKKIESDPCILKYVEEDRAENLEKQAADMRAELKDETALNKIVLASFYEENGLILDALINFEAATKIEPTVEDYQVAYGKFLDRNKLVTLEK